MHARRKSTCDSARQLGCVSYVMCRTGALPGVHREYVQQPRLLWGCLPHLWLGLLFLTDGIITFSSAWLRSYTGNLARLGSQWQAHWARKQVQAHKSIMIVSSHQVGDVVCSMVNISEDGCDAVLR
jgi:hypothetical protein